MRLSDRTQMILKNFATINEGIIIRPGNILGTLKTPDKSIYAFAKVDEEFEKTAPIYYIRKFIDLLSLYKEPDVEFFDDHLLIREGKKKMRYSYAIEEMIAAPAKDKIPTLQSPDVEFDLKWEDLQNVLRAAKTMQQPEIAFIGSGGNCSINTINTEKSITDTFSIDLAETNDTFQMVIKISNIRLIPQDYHVKISQRGISQFSGNDIDYFIGVDVANSKYQKG